MIAQRHDISFKSYKQVWDFQSILHEDIKKSKIAALDRTNKNYINHVVFCEHSKVITLGKSAKNSHLLTSESQLENDDIEIFNICLLYTSPSPRD